MAISQSSTKTEDQNMTKVPKGLLLEDKNIFGLNKVHKNVLQPAENGYDKVQPRITEDKSRTDADKLVISNKMLDFVSDGLNFDDQVIKSKAAHTLPYSPSRVNQIFANKTRLDNGVRIERGKYKFKPNKSLNYKTAEERKVDELKRIYQYYQSIIAYYKEDNRDSVLNTSTAGAKFKPSSFFQEYDKLSASDTELNVTGRIDKKSRARSLEDLDQGGGFFLTETLFDKEPQSTKASVKEETNKRVELKELNNIDWDEHTINQLSENTARWVVMKCLNNSKRKGKLLQLIENKFGRYTRDIEDLELFDFDLTDYEIRKIAEEKERVKMEKSSKLTESQKQVQIEEEARSKDENNNDEEQVPLYRMTQGLKRVELQKLRQPDQSVNKTARDISFEPTKAIMDKTFREKMMKKKVTDFSLLKSDNPITNEILNGHNYVFSEDQDKIVLENGQVFKKDINPVYPAEFTAWISGVELRPRDRPDLKKPIKGAPKKWNSFPEVYLENNMNKPAAPDYWQLMPITPDITLRRVARDNLTVNKIIKEWRSKWMTSNRWTLADIDQLITDMKNENAGVRFQAVVVCSRAVERIQALIDKLAQWRKKTTKKEIPDEFGLVEYQYFTRRLEETAPNNNLLYINELLFSDKLLECIEVLLHDHNAKVKLASAITIFTIFKKFIKPLIERYQVLKDKAESILRASLESFNAGDKFAAAQCLAMDGFCERKIVEILLHNYFKSKEQVTKEQVTFCLAELSAHNSLVIMMIEKFLYDEHARERILACKLFPCLRRAMTQRVTKKLMDLVWNDMHPSVRKVASQTLGRTGKGAMVHDELVRRMKSQNVFDRCEALKMLNYIGIMTPSLLEVFLKCFRDDCISVRELACKSTQRLNQVDVRIIDALLYVARFDRVTKIKSLAIQTLGLMATFTPEIRKALIWAMQFEPDPILRTDACHSIVLLIKQKDDQELIDILLDRHLLEEDPLVKEEIMVALNYLGFDPRQEVPIVTRIKSDIKKFNDKNQVIHRIKELDKELDYKLDKERYIWSEENESKPATSSLPRRKSTTTGGAGRRLKKSSKSASSAFSSIDEEKHPPSVFEPRLVKELNMPTARSLDLYESLQVINSYLVDNIKREKLLRRSLSKQQADNLSNASESSFLARLVEQEKANSKLDNKPSSPDLLSSKSASSIGYENAHSIDTIAEEN